LPTALADSKDLSHSPRVDAVTDNEAVEL